MEKMINHDETKEALLLIIKKAKIQFTAFGDYCKAVKSINDNEVYTKSYKAELKEKSHATFKEIATSLAEDYDKLCATIKEKESENDEILSLSSIELQNAISTIDTLGKSISEDLLSNIIDSFRGQYQALTIIGKLLIKHGLDIPTKYEACFYKTDIVMTSFRDVLHGFGSRPDHTVLYDKLIVELEKVALRFNVDIESELEGLKNHESNEAIKLNNMHAPMGLDVPLF